MTELIDTRMREYICKPVKVAALKFTGTLFSAAMIKDNAGNKVSLGGCFTCPETGKKLHYLMIDTLDGVMQANPGDYIVRGSLLGEWWAVKPEAFEHKYEETGNFV